MTKSQAVEAIEKFPEYKENFQLSLHLPLEDFRKVVEYFKEEPDDGEYRFGVVTDLYVVSEFGDLDVFGNTGVTRKVFQKKYLESDHPVEEFEVDYRTGTVYYEVGTVLEDGTETTIDGEADFWEVYEKCQN